MRFFDLGGAGCSGVVVARIGERASVVEHPGAPTM